MSHTFLYRAEFRSSVQMDVPLKRRPGRRLPSNVPFAVDNIWEYTRPDGMPSRRHCVCASPAPKFALEAASQGEAQRDAYVMCRLELVGNPRRHQIKVRGARYHTDVAKIQESILRSLRTGSWAEAPLAQKLALAPLFIPGATRDELHEAMQGSPLLRQTVDAAAANLSFWTALAEPHPEREIFFELNDDQAYILCKAEPGHTV